ncbi:LCP family protein [Enterococcus faecalis]|uniref:LCP family glycopolymer transferase n=1 Tax=Enterococcus TaxID=1350 RepID=UPI00071038C0|nr:LCP family protein [Enterococcus faecalis]KXF70015.1 hypothetical protein AQ486_10595 [Enterococcus faecalis]KXF74547.1 hypothetical protein AQ487_00115 [Enterococcus faecalis]MBC2812205.1 transcriptional regulator [Enterococcus faecalis]MBC2817103.1 transcriptional regulator [Enterococcus faecalis]MBC2821293.1 transcriptional regulator [Enterococcus faecalis]
MLKRIFFLLLGVTSVVILGSVFYFGKIYFDIKSAANSTYKTVERIPVLKNNNSTEAFSVLLLGVDNGDLNRNDVGRTDTIIVATVNPKNSQIKLVSIPRDTYVEIVGRSKRDKINHAYAFGGTAMTIATVEKLLDIPVDYYVEMNLKGLKELVDAVGGIEVNNPFSFFYEKTYFSIGKLYLNGESALKYSRMRYEDPEGDHGRQKRQQKIIEGISNKFKSINTLANYNRILDTVRENIKTDIPWNDMYTIIVKNKLPFFKVESKYLKGKELLGDGVVGDKDISYQQIDEVELYEVRELLKSQLK